MTGAAGFLASRLIPRLVAAGVRVVAVDQRDSVSGTPQVRFVTGDLEAYDVWRSVFRDLASTDVVVFHLAGMAHAGACESAPAKAVAANVDATVCLLEACRSYGVDRVVFPSTGLVYGDDVHGLAVEEARLAPQSIYAATKAAAEAILAGYAHAFRFSCEIARLANVYGPGGPDDSIISIVLRQGLNGGPFRVKSRRPIRDFIYCDDVAEALVRLAQSETGPGFRVTNVSTGTGTSIAALIELIGDMTGVRPELDKTEDDAAAESRLVLSNERLFSRTGWRPIHPLPDGLKATVQELRPSRA